VKTLLILLLAAVSLHAQNSQVVELSWGQGTWTGYTGQCTSSSQTNCLSGYKLTDMTTVLTYPMIPVNTLVYDIPSFPKPGNHNYSLVLEGIAADGSIHDSSPITTTFFVPSVALIGASSVTILNK
jgi:hypothetical protein